MINAQAPALRIIVIGAPPTVETAYRKHRILYYAVEPFLDNESPTSSLPDFINQSGLSWTACKDRRTGQWDFDYEPQRAQGAVVSGARSAVAANEGLGNDIAQELLARMLPVAITPGMANLSPANILKTAGVNDSVDGAAGKGRRFPPRTSDSGHQARFRCRPENVANKVTMLSVHRMPQVSGRPRPAGQRLPCRTHRARNDLVLTSFTACRRLNCQSRCRNALGLPEGSLRS